MSKAKEIFKKIIVWVIRNIILGKETYNIFCAILLTEHLKKEILNSQHKEPVEVDMDKGRDGTGK